MPNAQRRDLPQADHAESLADLASQLVRIPSVNPMGGAVDPDICYEHRVTAFLCDRLKSWGLPIELQQVEPGRENVVTCVQGAPGTPTVLIEVHQDTVPVNGMTIDPFGGQLRGGRLYGRGACDVKGGMASVLGLLRDAAASRGDGGWPTLVVAFAVNEEFGFSGANRLRRSWESGSSQLLPRAPDAVVVIEPTLCQIVVTHKGVVRWRIVAEGVAAHSSQPHLGQNAIYRMARVLQVLEGYAERLPAASQPEPLVGGPTLSVGLIEGGISANTVPDRCGILIDRRLMPGEDPHRARDAVIAELAQQLGDPEWLVHEPPMMVSAGLQLGPNKALAERLRAAALERLPDCRLIGAHYGTDASELAVGGVPTVVFGPGSIEQAHTADEWIDVDQLELAAGILRGFCRGLVG